MKKPRIEDFDPEAAAGRKLGSPLDDMPVIQKPHSPIKDSRSQTAVGRTATKESMRTRVLVEAHATEKTSGASEEQRGYARRTFDIFTDQLSYLTMRSLQDKLDGKEGSKNAMVREALDDWIKKREASK